jgi:hypothetical protein
MENPFSEGIRDTFSLIINSIEKVDLLPYMSVEELDKEVKRSFFKGNLNREAYCEWITWNEDTKAISLKRYVFFNREALCKS